MGHVQFMERLKIDETELQSRRAFFDITDEDLKRTAALRPFAVKHTDEIVEDLYELILGHPEARRFFPNESTVSHVKKVQKDYFLALFTDRLDLEYVKDRLRIGVAHERIGMPPKWYIGAYGRYLRTILKWLAKEITDPAEVRAAFMSIQKRVRFDESLAMDTYIAAHLDTIARHQAAIHELSTPVIQLYHRILLMPLIGTVDTLRAEQLMEIVLVKVVEEQAKVIIFDIAGVPVVDTKVADHLIKTTEAVKLLGAQVILSGISPTVAKTIVNLGLDISAMSTRSRLAEGLELAFDIIGKSVTSKTGKESGPTTNTASGLQHGSV